VGRPPTGHQRDPVPCPHRDPLAGPARTLRPLGDRRRTAPPQLSAFDQVAYRERNTVEGAINLLKHNRAVATRYGKRAAIFDGTVQTVQVASIRIWFRDLIR
jgi:transposase